MKPQMGIYFYNNGHRLAEYFHGGYVTLSLK